MVQTLEQIKAQLAHDQERIKKFTEMMGQEKDENMKDLLMLQMRTLTAYKEVELTNGYKFRMRVNFSQQDDEDLIGMQKQLNVLNKDKDHVEENKAQRMELVRTIFCKLSANPLISVEFMEQNPEAIGVDDMMTVIHAYNMRYQELLANVNRAVKFR